MDDDIRALASARVEVDALKAEVAETEKALADSPLGIQLAQFRKRLADMKSGCDDLANAIRLAAVDSFRATGHKTPHPAVKVKVYKFLLYTNEEAKEFCIRNYPQGLRLNLRTFEKAARVLEPDCVVFGEEPRATIKRDLSAYIAKKEEGA